MLKTMKSILLKDKIEHVCGALQTFYGKYLHMVYDLLNTVDKNFDQKLFYDQIQIKLLSLTITADCHATIYKKNRPRYGSKFPT